jgi:hypothetical protein
VPNTIQRKLQQAQEAIPGQRRVRLPWQQPTLGERAAATVGTVADTSGEVEARTKASLRETRSRARGLFRSARGRAEEAQERASAQLEETRARVGERLADVGEQAQIAQARTAEQVEGTRKRVRGAAGRRLAALRAATQPSPAGAPEGEAWLIPDETGGVAEEMLSPVDRAAASAARAERASQRATTAANQMIAALNRIASLQTRTQAQVTGPQGSPTDVEIRVGEATESPLMRAADAVARAVIAAGETVYDYSDGHYGRTPVKATDIRHEREKERERAQPVAIIEGHYERAGEKQGGRGRIVGIVGAVAALAAIAAVVFSQRQRIQQLIARRAPTPSQAQPWVPTGPISPTPTFDRVTRGELLIHPTGATAGTSAGGATRTSAREIIAGEPGDVASPRP